MQRRSGKAFTTPPSACLPVKNPYFELLSVRGPPKGVGHGGGRWKLNQVFSRFFKNPEKTRLKPGKNPVETRKKTCWKMWRVRRKLGIWWCRDGPGTYHSRTCQGKNPEKTRFNFSPTPSSPTPFGRSRSVFSMENSATWGSYQNIIVQNYIQDPVKGSYLKDFLAVISRALAESRKNC